jgi:hypothetical protein
MTINENLHVFIYDFKVYEQCEGGNGMEVEDHFIIGKVIGRHRKELTKTLEIYVTSGFNIFSTADLTEDFCIVFKEYNKDYKVRVNAASKTYFNLKNIKNMKMEDNNIAHTLISNIVKQAFRGTELRQLGKLPRFFDKEKATVLQSLGIQFWPGFRASAIKYQSGLALVMDNVFRFMTTTDCNTLIN